jgi:hypothetical protein
MPDEQGISPGERELIVKSLDKAHEKLDTIVITCSTCKERISALETWRSALATTVAAAWLAIGMLFGVRR